PKDTLPEIAADICDCSTSVAEPWRSAGTIEEMESMTAFCADGEPARNRPTTDAANTSNGGMGRVGAYVNAPAWVRSPSTTVRRANNPPGMSTDRAHHAYHPVCGAADVSSARSSARYRSRSAACCCSNAALCRVSSFHCSRKLRGSPMREASHDGHPSSGTHRELDEGNP